MSNSLWDTIQTLPREGHEAASYQIRRYLNLPHGEDLGRLYDWKQILVCCVKDESAFRQEVWMQLIRRIRQREKEVCDAKIL